VDIYPHDRRETTAKKHLNQHIMVDEPVSRIEQESDDDEQILAEQFLLKGYEEPVTDQAQHTATNSTS